MYPVSTLLHNYWLLQHLCVSNFSIMIQLEVNSVVRLPCTTWCQAGNMTPLWTACFLSHSLGTKIIPVHPYTVWCWQRLTCQVITVACILNKHDFVSYKTKTDLMSHATPIHECAWKNKRDTNHITHIQGHVKKAYYSWMWKVMLHPCSELAGEKQPPTPHYIHVCSRHRVYAGTRAVLPLGYLYIWVQLLEVQPTMNRSIAILGVSHLEWLNTHTAL